MKLSEATNCGKCGKKLLHTQLPFCFKIELTPLVLDQVAARQTEGMTMMLGGALAIAEVMVPNPEVLKEDEKMKTCTYVCFHCMTAIVDGVDELSNWHELAKTKGV